MYGPKADSGEARQPCGGFQKAGVHDVIPYVKTWMAIDQAIV
jgi:hypothetical protein